MKQSLLVMGFMMLAVPMMAQQSAFDDFKKRQTAEFELVKQQQQAEFDAFRKRVNEEYAEFMRQKWEAFPMHEAEKPAPEPIVEPIEFVDESPAPEPAPAPKEETKPQTPAKPQEQPQRPPQEDKRPPKENISPISMPKPQLDTKPVEIAVKPKVVVVPTPPPAPEPIAPVKPKEQEFKRVTISYYGTLVTVGFPTDEQLHLKALNENAAADCWKQLSEPAYDITVSSALEARKANNLCDWGYMQMLQAITEKRYGKTNEAVLVEAFLMTQSGYRVRLGMSKEKLYMLVASAYDIFDHVYYILDGSKFYLISPDQCRELHICASKYEKERTLSMQIAQLPKLNAEPTPKRTLTSKKGVTSVASVNKNLIDFFNTYPQACISGNEFTRWAAYANTPLDKAVKDMLYPPLKRTIEGMSEREAVGILLNWVQTAFEYQLDDKVWGHDRAFFAQETLYYPYCDCEDRAILFSRLVRDLIGLDVVLLYYPGHLATAVAFTGDEKGDFLTYKQRKYIVCDPTFINAGVGRTMPNMNNRQAQVIALK